MKLEDGLEIYRRYDPKFWDFTLEVEKSAGEMAQLLVDDGYQPTPNVLTAARDLLIDIERWKAGCIEELTGHYAVQNSERDVWNAFQSALRAHTDREAILSIMLPLKGFGSSRDEQGQHSAKRASAVLRMFKPEEWGVVDWRTVAMLNLLNNTKWDVDAAMKLAQKQDFRAIYKDVPINENAAIEHNQMYRDRVTSSLRRTADVEMAIFGLTFKVWPFKGGLSISGSCIPASSTV